MNDEIKSWKTGKEHISFSEVADWLNCMFQHKLKHIDKLGTSGVTPHLFFGTGVHASNEKYILTRNMDVSIAHKEITNGWEENLELFTKGPFPSWAPDGYGSLNDWIDKATKITNDVPKFLDLMFPNWECVAVEEQLYENIPNHYLKFKGYIDGILSTKDGRGHKKYWIIDWKTCGWGWQKSKQEDFKVQLQLLLYKYFWTTKHGINPRDVKCAFALLKRDGKPGMSVSLIPVQSGPTPVEKGLNVINNHIRNVEKGFFIKNREACKFCEFSNTDFCPPNL